MKGIRKFQSYLKKERKNSEFRKAFDEEEAYASVAIQIARLRERQRLTQGEFAKMLHTTQQNVSRLENPHNNSCSLKTLVRVARVFHKELRVQFI